MEIKTLIEGLGQGGAAGAIMGLVMLIVVRPLLGRLMKQLDADEKHLQDSKDELKAAVKERQDLCLQHHAYHATTNAVLDGLLSSVNALVARANGGRRE